MTPFLWECPNCDVRVRTNSREIIDHLPVWHRCKGRVPAMPDARPVRVVPGVTVAPHLAPTRAWPEGDDAA